MKKAIVRIVYDEKYLEEQNIDLESEIQGWLEASGIEVESVERID